MKKFVKNFNNFIKKTIFKVQNNTNINFKINSLNFVKNFNKWVEKTIFRLQNKKYNKPTISKFNRYLISFISLLFFYLFYLSIPVLYDKNWVQKNIESLLLKDFKIYFSLSSDMSYRILPSPHYLIKDSKIFKEGNKTSSQAEIKKLKVFVSQKNFFNKKKMTFKYIEIDNANFSLLNNDLKILKNNIPNKFSSKKIKINNSNIILKKNLSETISIIRISKALLFHDDKNLLNLFKLKGDIFDIPFNLDYERKFDSLKKEEVNFVAKTLKLNIFNTRNGLKNNKNQGKNIISFLQSKINTDYKIEDDTMIFNSDNSRIKNTKVSYNGKLLTKPFDLNLNIDLDNFDLSKIFINDSILHELIRSKVLFHDNISANVSVTTKLNSIKKIFHSAKIHFNVVDGKLNLDKTKLINDKIGLIELDNSNLSFEEKRLILNTNIIVRIADPDKLFSLLQTNKKYRKKIEKIIINLNYDFLYKEIKFNSIKIDNQEINNELLSLVSNFNDNSLNNWNKNRRLLNALFKLYEG